MDSSKFSSKLSSRDSRFERKNVSTLSSRSSSSSPSPPPPSHSSIISCTYKDCLVHVRSIDILRRHLVQVHKLKIDRQELKFNGSEEFFRWKEKYETSTNCQYSKVRGSVSEGRVYYRCYCRLPHFDKDKYAPAKSGNCISEIIADFDRHKREYRVSLIKTHTDHKQFAAVVCSDRHFDETTTHSAAKKFEPLSSKFRPISEQSPRRSSSPRSSKRRSRSPDHRSKRTTPPTSPAAKYSPSESSSLGNQLKKDAMKMFGTLIERVAVVSDDETELLQQFNQFLDQFLKGTCDLLPSASDES